MTSTLVCHLPSIKKQKIVAVLVRGNIIVVHAESHCSYTAIIINKTNKKVVK
jgi:hypothetical protein